MKVLFACSELFPLIKTGGLADVAYNLPLALQQQGCQVRIVLPAYRQVKTALKAARQHVDRVASLSIAGQPVTLLQSAVPGNELPLYLVDCPPLFSGGDNPYAGYGDESAQRFALFCRAIVALATGLADPAWQPELLHCNDWQTGLAPALLADMPERPAILFTIHNLAYQGLFSRETFERLQLPDALWDFRALEFYGQWSFIKGGIVFADAVNTVSPSYAKEVLTPAAGCGLDGLLRHRGAAFGGILNGIDTEVWDPANDDFLEANYDSSSLSRKVLNKQALLRDFALPAEADTLLLGMVSRLTEQKGIDLLLTALPELLALPLTLVILGSGDADYSAALSDWRERHPKRIGLYLGYEERLAHRIIAGADALLIPSRYEPCGLTQLYSQRYGTVPVASAVGGLVDTIVDRAEGGTGILFTGADAMALPEALRRILQCFRDESRWRALQRAGMAQDFSWNASTKQYLRRYQDISSLISYRIDNLAASG